MQSENWKQIIKAALILFVVFFVVVTTLDHVYKFIFVNRGIQFYRQKPGLLLACLVFACIIGFLGWLVFRIFRNNRRGLIIFLLSLAILGLGTTSITFFYFGIRFLMFFRSDFGRMAMRDAGATPLMLFTLGTAIVLLAFTAGSVIYFVKFLRKSRICDGKNGKGES